MLYLLGDAAWVLVMGKVHATNSKAGINDITVTNTAINQLPKDAQLVITQKN